MRVQDQPAYILHHYPYRDSSQIFELFSRDYGRLSVMSRGSRSAKSKQKTLLQLFHPLLVCWSGKGDMPLLTRVEPVDTRLPELKGNALPSAFYINELLIKLLHRHDVHEDIFGLYQDTLYLLADQQKLENHLRLFEKQLLQFLGFGLNLVVDADSGDAVREGHQYNYFIEHGPVLAAETHSESRQLLINGESLLAFENDDLGNTGVRKEIKSLMRFVLAHYLEGKPLKSRELFR
ncbi:MAG: DNA repair protein RecO [Gammaproteobacteria bacterium]|nr:DNA repair protein RecO [Gammaproteobacteria bacterium]